MCDWHLLLWLMADEKGGKGERMVKASQINLRHMAYCYFFLFSFFYFTPTCIGCDVIHAIRAGAVRATERGCSERKRKSSVTYHRQAQGTRVYIYVLLGHVQRYALVNFACRPNVSSILRPAPLLKAVTHLTAQRMNNMKLTSTYIAFCTWTSD